MRFFIAVTVISLSIFAIALPVRAANQAELERLFLALDTNELFQIMRAEGLIQANELRDEMLSGRGGDGWSQIASRIYDIETMAATFRSGFEANLADTDVSQLLVFFEGSAGSEIIALELSARRALMDAEVEAAAKESYASLMSTDKSRVKLLTEFIDANDLVELNVMGALNASLAFYQGLADGGAFQLGEEQILRDVWAQEAEIREDTSTWMTAFLALSYQPLDDADLEAYIALSTSEAGQDLNAALFAGFDDVFRDVSFNLGSAASRFMGSEEL